MKFEAERQKAAKERCRWQKGRAALQSSLAPTFACPKCSRGCASRLRVFIKNQTRQPPTGMQKLTISLPRKSLSARSQTSSSRHVQLLKQSVGLWSLFQWDHTDPFPYNFCIQAFCPDQHLQQKLDEGSLLIGCLLCRQLILTDDERSLLISHMLCWQLI